MNIFRRIYWWAIWKRDGLTNKQIKARFDIYNEAESYGLGKKFGIY